MNGFTKMLLAVLVLLTVPFAQCSTTFGQSEAQLEIEKAERTDQQRAAIIAKAMNASICVFSADGKGGGSGVIVTSDGFALTNYHVVKPCGPYMHCGMADGTIHDAVVVGTDPTGDVALIKLLGREDFPTAQLGDSDAVRIGDSCFAVGNPFLLATNFQPTVTWGIVSGTHRYQYPSKTLLEYTDCIQTDAAINPGNSGGPLFDSTGKLVGINGRGSFEKRGRVNVGVGYAISMNQIKLFWEHLNSGRVVDHASLGATVKSSSDGRVLVNRVLETSDAYRRGLRIGDEILRFGDREIETVNELKNILGIYPKGWRLPLQYRRGDETFNAMVRLPALHTLNELLERQNMDDSGKPQPAPKIGAESIPATAKKEIELRDGYANYYFNRLRRDQLWQSDATRAALSSKTEPWRISGNITGEQPKRLRVVLDNESSAIQWGDSTAFLKAENLASQRVPDQSGGLLVALHLWRAMSVAGPENLGESFYLGSLPLDDGFAAKVIQTRHEGTESNFYFDLDSGVLQKIETWTDEALDPCEIRFSNYREMNGVTLPFTWRATSGDDFLWEIQIDEIRFGGEPAKSGGQR